MVAITGATGFYGQHIARALLRRGFGLRVLERREGDVQATQQVTPVLGTLSDRNDLDRLLDGVDAVVHCAGLVRGANRHAFHETNVVGTARLVHAALASPRRPRFTLISSLAAREPKLSSYAASKRSGEDIVQSLADDLEWLILRPPVIYGPGDLAMLRLFKLAAAGIMPVPKISPPGTCRIAMVYVSDAAAAVAESVTAASPTRTTIEFHDGHADGYDWPVLVNAMSDALERRVRSFRVSFRVARALANIETAASLCFGREPIFTPGKTREMFHANWSVKDNPLSRFTNWAPRVTLMEGFRMTANWYSAQSQI